MRKSEYSYLFRKLNELDFNWGKFILMKQNTSETLLHDLSKSCISL
jgi:hypothetical protein